MKIGMKILAVGLFALMMGACGKSNEEPTVTPPTPPDPPAPVDGSSWVLAKWNNKTDMAGKVYLQLNSDNTFNLYQSIENPGFEKRTGTYTIEDETLSGVYSGGVSWKSSYTIVSKTGSAMTLKASDNIVSEYSAVTIPDYVTDGIVDVRAAEDGMGFL